MAITGPVAALISGVRYAANGMQVFGATLLAGARVAPSVQATAMEASSQVDQALHAVIFSIAQRNQN